MDSCATNATAGVIESSKITSTLIPQCHHFEPEVLCTLQVVGSATGLGQKTGVVTTSLSSVHSAPTAHTRRFSSSHLAQGSPLDKMELVESRLPRAIAHNDQVRNMLLTNRLGLDCSCHPISLSQLTLTQTLSGLSLAARIWVDISGHRSPLYAETQLRVEIYLQHSLVLVTLVIEPCCYCLVVEVVMLHILVLDTLVIEPCCYCLVVEIVMLRILVLDTLVIEPCCYCLVVEIVMLRILVLDTLVIEPCCYCLVVEIVLLLCLRGFPGAQVGVGPVVASFILYRLGLVLRTHGFKIKKQVSPVVGNNSSDCLSQ
ncbi:hypothetical protein RRG08_002826 [Elysia crispata]|uniref:Uncharacterized protein n=1 Tax=Elysia crispata TaxID=231223 RepID=A0AAE1CM45_9GAST|nr:hypothetical protein RRG08_002826 [Elysia crispata]